jgi:predicted nucleic acid-binding protein
VILTNILKAKKKSKEDREYERLKKEVLKEFNKDYYKLAHDVSVQVIAATLYSLTRRFDFGKKDVLEFIDALNDTYRCMNGNDILGPFNSDDLKRQIKQEYGVDLNTFIKIGWQEE